MPFFWWEGLGYEASLAYSLIPRLHTSREVERSLGMRQHLRKLASLLFASISCDVGVAMASPEDTSPPPPASPPIIKWPNRKEDYELLEVIGKRGNFSRISEGGCGLAESCLKVYGRSSFDCENCKL